MSARLAGRVRHAAVAGVVLAALGGRARADDVADLEQAAQLYDDGKRSFDLGDYPAAIDRWEASYRLSSAPLLLFNLGQAYRLAGDCGRANHLYQAYRRLAPAPPNPSELAAAMEKCDGVPPAGVAVAPAPATATPPATATAAPTPSPERPGPARTSAVRRAGAITIGVGAVAGVAAASYALIARRKADALAAQPAGTSWTPELAGLERDGATAASRARVLGAVGLAAVVGGATLWWLGRSRGRVAVHVAVTPTQGEAVLACAF